MITSYNNPGIEISNLQIYSKHLFMDICMHVNVHVHAHVYVHVGSWEASSSDSFSAQVSNESANELGLNEKKIFKGGFVCKEKWYLTKLASFYWWNGNVAIG